MLALIVFLAFFGSASALLLALATATLEAWRLPFQLAVFAILLPFLWLRIFFAFVLLIGTAEASRQFTGDWPPIIGIPLALGSGALGWWIGSPVAQLLQNVVRAIAGGQWAAIDWSWEATPLLGRHWPKPARPQALP